MTALSRSSLAGRVCIISAADESARRVEQLLSDQGYVVWGASSAIQRIDQLHLAPDVVLIDARTMLDEAVATLAALHNHPDTDDFATILLLPHAPPPALLDRVVTLASDYMTEPLSDDELCTRVALRMRGQQRLRQLREQSTHLAQGNAEHRWARAELSLRAEQYGRTFDLLPIGALMVSPENHIERVNEAFCRFTGYSPDELIGRPPTFLTHPKEHAATLVVGQQLAGGQIASFTRDRRRYVRKDGSTALGKLTVHALRAEDGRLQAFLAFVEDITSRAQVEDQFARNARIQQAITNCSMSLVAVTTDAASREQLLVQGLQQLVDGVNASRAYLLRNTDDPQLGLSLELVAEAWSAGQRSRRSNPVAQQIPRLPYAVLPDAHRRRIEAGLPSGGPIAELYAETPDLRCRAGNAPGSRVTACVLRARGAAGDL
jgi:PAS domain S-box-containing protein